MCPRSGQHSIGENVGFALSSGAGLRANRMPPLLLFDLSEIDLNQLLFDQEAIRRANPQRGHMEHLNGVIWYGDDKIVGYKDVREDEFWVEGHIPGRPLLPGVIMLESAAQLCSFFAHQYLGWKGFIGFAGLQDVRFRSSVSPGKRMLILATMLPPRHRRIMGATQGVVDGNVVFEAEIIGVQM